MLLLTWSINYNQKQPARVRVLDYLSETPAPAASAPCTYSMCTSSLRWSAKATLSWTFSSCIVSVFPLLSLPHVKVVSVKKNPCLDWDRRKRRMQPSAAPRPIGKTQHKAEHRDINHSWCVYGRNKCNHIKWNDRVRSAIERAVRVSSRSCSDTHLCSAWRFPGQNRRERH